MLHVGRWQSGNLHADSSAGFTFLFSCLLFGHFAADVQSEIFPPARRGPAVGVRTVYFHFVYQSGVIYDRI